MSGALIETFGRTRSGEDVARVRLRGDIEVALLTYGALIAELHAPDRDGTHANVVLGLPDFATYEAHNPSFGVTAGRFANRIGGARFTLDGAEYRLSANEGQNTLHGGARGFSKRVWTLLEADAHAASMRYVSADGEEGFPGTLETTVRFAVDGATLRIDYEARTDRPTVLNLTNHSYFNLVGAETGDVFGHVLQVAADEILELDANSLPTGRRLAVEATPFDFRAPHAVGERIRDAHEQIRYGLGYDCCFVLRGTGLRPVAQVWEPGSGRHLVVHTDQPAVQFYSGNKLTGALAGPHGRTYRSGDGLCLETQHFPDAPNHPDFPSTVLRPGEVFRSRTDYVFGTASALGAVEPLG